MKYLLDIQKGITHMQPLNIYYDIEVFDKLSLAGFLISDPADKKKDILLEFTNTPNPLNVTMTGVTIYNNNVKMNGQMLARLNSNQYHVYGFNNHNYDDFILAEILHSKPTADVKRLSDSYINKTNQMRQWPLFETLDLRDQLLSVSLKKFESMAGLSVKESTIPFDKADNFNDMELLEVIRYNIQDLKATKKLHEIRDNDAHGNYFTNKRLLVEHYGTAKSYRYSNTTIASIYLMDGNKLDKLNPAPASIIGVPDDVAKFLNHINQVSPMITDERDKKRQAVLRKQYAPLSLTIEQFGNVFTFGSGGLHSAVGHLKTTKSGKHKPVYDNLDVTDVYQLDVTSMFPNIMIRDGLLGPSTGKYQRLVSDRIKNKRNHDPKAKTQKIVINSSYGGMRSNWLALYNPKCAIHVNIAGMVAVYNLARGLSKYGQIIQVNTDGVAVKLNYDPNAKKHMLMIKKQWENYFKLNLEVSHFKRLIQRDVNNYIAIKDDDKLKLKGGAIAQAQTRDELKSTTPRVLQQALLHHILSPDDDLTSYLNKQVKELPFDDWCWTLSSPKSKLQTGYTVDDNNQRLPQQVNRAYASKYGSQYFKERTAGKPAKFAGTSQQLVINNDDITGQHAPSDIDLEWYKREVLRQADAWKITDNN